MRAGRFRTRPGAQLQLGPSLRGGPFLEARLMHRIKPRLNHDRFRKTSPPCRLRLEALEDRSLPSTLTVTSTADAGTGTLRDAISKANSGEKIVFALPNHSTISLTSGSLSVTKSIVISGPGPSALTISGNH